MEKINSNDFVSFISDDKGVFCLFTNEGDKIGNITKAIENISDEEGILNFGQFCVQESEENSRLAEEIEIPNTPVLMMFRNGSFVKYTNKILNKKSIKKFIGSTDRFKK